MKTATRRPALIAFLSLFCVTVLLALPGRSESFLWTSATDGDWSDAGNWFEGKVPADSGADIVLQNRITSDIDLVSTIDASWAVNGAVNSLTFGPGFHRVADNGDFVLALGAGVDSFTLGAGGLRQVDGLNALVLPELSLGANQTWEFIRPLSDTNNNGGTISEFAPRVLIHDGVDGAAPGTVLSLLGNPKSVHNPAQFAMGGQVQLLGENGAMGANIDRINLAGAFIRLGADSAAAAADANFNRIAETTTLASYGGGGLVVFRQGTGTEDLGDLRLEAGTFQVMGNVTGGGGTSTYRFASLAHREEGTALVLESGTGAADQINVQFADATGIDTGVNGIMGGWAVGTTQQGGFRFLAPAADNTTITTVLGTNVGDDTALNSAGSTDNINLTYGGGTLSADLAINSLRIPTGGTTQLNGHTLRVGSGGVIFAANSTLTGGQITAGTAPDTGGTLYFHNQYLFGTNSSIAGATLTDNGTGVVNVVYTGTRTNRVVNVGIANTYTGFTAINGGRVSLGGGGTNWFGATPSSFVADQIRISDGVIHGNGGRLITENFGVLLTGGGLTWFHQSGNGNIQSAISGDGQLAVDNGSLILSGSMSNTYTGATVVSGGGTLTLSKTGGATAVAGDIFVGVNPTFALGSQALLVLGGSNQIADTSVVTLLRPNADATGKARFRLNGQNETIGGLSGWAETPANAVVENTHGTIASTLTLNPAAGAYHRFDGVVQDSDTGGGGSLALVLDGHAGGRQALYGDNTYSGGTTINGGTLLAGHDNALGVGPVVVNAGVLALLDGVVAMNPITFNPGSTLTGTGTLSVGGDLNAPDTIAPGFSTGTLTIDVGAGNALVMSGATTTEIEIAGLGDFDILAIVGDGALAGDLAITLLDGFLPERGTTFDVITATGELTGMVNLAGSDGMWFSADLVDGTILRLTSQIPEPTSILLFALAGSAALRRRRQ